MGFAEPGGLGQGAAGFGANGNQFQQQQNAQAQANLFGAQAAADAQRQIAALKQRETESLQALEKQKAAIAKEMTATGEAIKLAEQARVAAAVEAQRIMNKRVSEILNPAGDGKNQAKTEYTKAQAEATLELQKEVFGSVSPDPEKKKVLADTTPAEVATVFETLQTKMPETLNAMRESANLAQADKTKKPITEVFVTNFTGFAPDDQRMQAPNNPKIPLANTFIRFLKMDEPSAPKDAVVDKKTASNNVPNGHGAEENLGEEYEFAELEKYNAMAKAKK